MSANVRRIEVDEVLPKGAAISKTDDPLMALIARLMDDQFSIPGTRIRFGLDPIIGLIPGFGDTAGGVISLLMVFQSMRSGVPRVILARMAGNILLNSLIGAIPVGGDLFSAWFKSNAKNYQLHQRHAGTARKAGARDWIFVILLIAVLAAVLITVLLVVTRAIYETWRWILSN